MFDATVPRNVENNINKKVGIKEILTSMQKKLNEKKPNKDKNIVNSVTAPEEKNRTTQSKADCVNKNDSSILMKRKKSTNSKVKQTSESTQEVNEEVLPSKKRKINTSEEKTDNENGSLEWIAKKPKTGDTTSIALSDKKNNKFVPTSEKNRTCRLDPQEKIEFYRKLKEKLGDKWSRLTVKQKNCLLKEKLASYCEFTQKKKKLITLKNKKKLVTRQNHLRNAIDQTRQSWTTFEIKPKRFYVDPMILRLLPKEKLEFEFQVLIFINQIENFLVCLGSPVKIYQLLQAIKITSKSIDDEDSIDDFLKVSKQAKNLLQSTLTLSERIPVEVDEELKKKRGVKKCVLEKFEGIKRITHNDDLLEIEGLEYSILWVINVLKAIPLALELTNV